MAALPQNVMQPGFFSGKIVKDFGLNYLLYLPQEYSEASRELWPMLVFLHGSGERGHDLEKVKVHGPPKLIAAGREFPFVVLAPQCPDSTDWDADALMGLIRHITTEYHIDASRIWVSGLSMGGWATWDVAMAYPHYFAAIAPVCGRVNRNYPSRVADLVDVAIWVFHGAADDVVPILESARMVRALRESGHQTKFTIYPIANHDSWTETYDNPEFYDWLMQQQRQ